MQTLGAFWRNAPALLRATALWWILSLGLLVLISYATTGKLGSTMTLRPDVEGEYPDLTATFLMLSLVINLVVIGLVSALALPILRGQDGGSGFLPRVPAPRFIQTLWALVLTCLIIAIVSAVLSALIGLALPYLPIRLGFIIMPIISVVISWAVWLICLRVFVGPIDLKSDPQKRVGLGGIAVAACLLAALSLVLFAIGSFAIVSPLSEAIIANIVGWVILMLALSSVAVRVLDDE